MKKAIYSIIFVTFFSACNNGDSNKPATDSPGAANKLSGLSWVIGQWYMDMPDGKLVEVWQKVSDTLYTGYSVMVSAKGDTLFSEKMKLAQRGDTLWYIPAVSDQNKGQEVLFKEKSCSATEATFENPLHDFPQRIIYRKDSDSSLYARIEGVANGTGKSEELLYKKLKQ